MHISSLPSDYGIGDFGKEAYNFVDFLTQSKQKYWQVFPLGMTGFGDSPYQCFSAFAGNPYFIDLDELIDRGYLTMMDVSNADLGLDNNYVDYAKLYLNKMNLLKKSYEVAKKNIYNDLTKFYHENTSWLREFALFMAIKEYNNNIPWNRWNKKFKNPNSEGTIEFEKNNKESIYFWVFTQYLFFKQWLKLKEYANNNGIKIIGDLPIYVAEDSSDAWGNSSIFNLDENSMPKTVAGCPPDFFSKTGQLWGNPIYDWDNIEKTDYKWWIDRIKHSFTLFDTLRIDHFRGFDGYWEINYGDKTAVNGKLVNGPGIRLFNRVKEELGDLDIIAEDLGFYTDSLEKFLEQTGFPNMKVLQFAFHPKEDSQFLPHNYSKNCVAYIGTHDNYPAMAWYKLAPKDEIEYANKYLRLNAEEGINWGLIRGTWSSSAYLAIAQMQDFLGLGEEARMNIPGTVGDNWTWRISKRDLSKELANTIADITHLYRR